MYSLTEQLEWLCKSFQYTSIDEITSELIVYFYQFVKCNYIKSSVLDHTLWTLSAITGLYELLHFTVSTVTAGHHNLGVIFCGHLTF